MTLFQWFNTAEVDEIARAIAADLVIRVPPSRLESQDRKAADRLRNTHEAVFARAGSFARTHRLNFYQKARLGNQFRWALKEAGYPPDFVESWTYELVVLISLSSITPKKPG